MKVVSSCVVFTRDLGNWSGMWWYFQHAGDDSRRSSRQSGENGSSVISDPSTLADDRLLRTVFASVQANSWAVIVDKSERIILPATISLYKSPLTSKQRSET